MKINMYLKDKSISLILHVLGILAVSLYMNIIGNSNDSICLLIVGWILVVLIYYSIDFIFRKKYFDSMLFCLDNLSKKYLIADVMDKPQRLEDVLYKHILRMGNKAMLEEISNIRHERDDYMEYIEQWVHEVKSPLSAMKLICENNRNDETKKVMRELERANRYVEQVLYYARSENVQKDYLIKEVNLLDIVKKSIHNNKQLLREEQIKVNLDCDQFIYTDSKWISFIIDQCIVNSVKYGAKQIIFQSEVSGSKTIFSIIDDGIGILEEDLPRIFEKGFTGKNGHEKDKSTGIGLYLCKKLCDKLDVEIEVESKVSRYTIVHLTFVNGRLN